MCLLTQNLVSSKYGFSSPLLMVGASGWYNLARFPCKIYLPIPVIILIFYSSLYILVICIHSQAVVAYAFNYSTQEAETRRSL